VDRRPLADLDEDLYPYRRLIGNGLAGVMAAHVIFDQVDALPAGFSPRWIQQELRATLGFDGAIFTDDLSMAGAGVVGDMPHRAAAALEAGCDVLSLCNDRKGVLQVIDSLQGTGDPLSQVRMVRLHGKPGPTRPALHASADWQACEAAVKGSMERPDLKLNS
jgi:beta-N-acetylhexosaminidase